MWLMADERPAAARLAGWLVTTAVTTGWLVAEPVAGGRVAGRVRPAGAELLS